MNLMDATLAKYSLTSREKDAITAICTKLQPFNDLSYTIDIDNAPKLPYHQHAYQIGENSSRYSIHNGQTKLLLCEIIAIINTQIINPDLKNVVYAGAAPGSHIWALVKLFPNLRFHLYDMADFDKDLFKLSSVKIYKQYFTNAEALAWKSGNVLFISDIRTGSVNVDNTEGADQIFEKCVMEDMELQKQLVLALDPCASLLKCRFPFITNPAKIIDGVLDDSEIVDVNTTYFEGEFIYQPFSRSTSTEGRLYVVRGAKMREYSAKQYEQVFYYINTILREWHMTDVDIKLLMSIRSQTGLKNICNCYDCSMMLKIFETYCLHNPHMTLQIVNCVSLLFESTHQRIPEPHGHIGLMCEYRDKLFTFDAQEKIRKNREHKQKVWNSNPIPSSRKYR